MTDSTDLDHSFGSDFNPGILLPLLERANRLAAGLAAAKYDGIERWTADIRISLLHGIDSYDRVDIRLGHPPIPRFKIVARIESGIVFRYFTLDEAELILENLKGKEPYL